MTSAFSRIGASRSSGTGPESAPAEAAHHLWLTSAPYAAVERHLATSGISAELDHVHGLTTIFPFDQRDRAIPPTVELAEALTRQTGAPSMLLRAAPTPPSFPGAPRFAMRGIRIEAGEPCQTEDLPCQTENLTVAEVEAILRDLGIRPSGNERWLVAGVLPGGGSFDAFERLASRGLSPELHPFVRVWTSDGSSPVAEQRWFVGVVEIPAPVEPRAVDVGELMSHLAESLRAGKSPLLLARVRPSSLELLAASSRQWPDFPLSWGHRRGWVHPVHGSGIASSDPAATRFATEWQRAGGTCDPVALRALTRRVALGPSALPQALRLLGMPEDLIDTAVAAAEYDRRIEASARVVESRIAGAHGALGGAPAPMLTRFAHALNTPTPVNRFANGLSALAAGVLIADVAHDGIGGWDWLKLAVFGVVLATGVAGALRHEKPAKPQPNSACKVAS